MKFNFTLTRTLVVTACKRNIDVISVSMITVVHFISPDYFSDFI